jgi:hypothetical protein
MTNILQHYETLGIQPGATVEEILQAYYERIIVVAGAGAKLPTSGAESDQVVALYAAHFALICEEQRLPKQEAV